MKIRVLSLASQDLIRGKKFYEKQQEGIGDYFLDSLHSDIDSLILYYGIHRKIRDYHCMFSKRFPYAIYYKIVGQEIRVYRVLDCRKDPKSSSQALK